MMKQILLLLIEKGTSRSLLVPFYAL